MSTRQLVYLSRAARRLSAKDLHDILEASQRRNAEVGVTGLLLCDGSRFIQALEGTATAVSGVMARIAVDRRHKDIVYMHNADVPLRQFGAWSMRGWFLRDADDAQAFHIEVKELTGNVTQPSMLAAFIGFAAMSKVPFVKHLVER